MGGAWMVDGVVGGGCWVLVWEGGAVGGWVVGFCGVVGRTEGALAEEPEQIEVLHAAQRSFSEGASALHMHDSMGGSQLLQKPAGCYRRCVADVAGH